ncbi:arginine kinase Oct f 2-like [Argonauta hians]
MSELSHLWRRLATSKSKSLLKKHLTADKLIDLKSLRTSFGGTINDCIRFGCRYPRSTIGLFACDQDAYKKFAEIFEPIIRQYHRLGSENHPPSDYGDPTLVNTFRLRFFEGHVISSNINVSRNFEGYRFSSSLSLGDRLKIEKLAVSILNSLEGDLMGQYFPYVGMTENERKTLMDKNMYFDNSNRLMKAAGCFDDWPSGRGAFLGLKRNLGCWINEADHLRVFCTEKGTRLTDCYVLITRFLVILEKKAPLATGIWGHLSFCLSNIGTAMTICLLVKLPNYELKEESLEVCKKFDIECRRIQKLSSYWVWEIMNNRQVGTTEFQILNDINQGVLSVLSIEYNDKSRTSIHLEDQH